MTKTSPSTSKILHTLRNGNRPQEQASVLTYLCSNIGRVKLSETINEFEYVELCNLLLMLVVRTYEDKVNEDNEMKNEDAERALHCVLQMENHHVDFFKLLLDIERKKRVKALEFLNRIESKILAHIIQDSTTVDFISDCFHMIRPSLMKWIAANSSEDNIQLLIETETQVLSHDQENEEQLISHTLTMLHRLYEYATMKPPDFGIETIHPLLFDRVITLAYMGHKRQRIPALKLLNQALNTNVISYIKGGYSSLWGQYKITLQNTYCSRMSLLVKLGDGDWANQWCLSIKMLGTDLHRGAELINNLLSVEEKAFKSTDMTVRKKAFEAWKHLIDNFALNATELTTLRRIKLLCIPLNAKNSKIEIVAIAKLETWWHLIVNLYPNLDKSVNQVIEQFLNFCFGPLGDTPLLSKKCDVVVSPGKRFSVTKLMAIDALLQLLIKNPIDRHTIPTFIEDRLPNALPNAVFQGCYKCLFHSVGEATLLFNELDKEELDNRKELNEILWASLMIYIQQSSAEHKASMYKELILILEEVIGQMTDSPLLIGFVFDVIVVEFVKVIQYLIYDDNTLMNVLLKLLSPKILKNADKKYLNNLTHLIDHAIKSQDTKLYHSHTLPFIKAALIKMELLVEHEVNSYVSELWLTFADIVIKYMEQNQRINEGISVDYKFEAIQSLIIFPIRNIFWCNLGSIMKISKLWRELYKHFDMQTDLVTTVKSNEILQEVTAKMEKYMIQDKRCYRIIAHCFDALISSINYEAFLSENSVPPLIKLLSDITVVAFNDMAIAEIELSLRATSSLLITVYGLNQKCALMYLHILKPSIESMLKVDKIESIAKAIVNTWETIVIMFRGSTKFLTPKLISSYRISILLALRHNNSIIAEQASSLINIKTNLNEEMNSLFDEFEEISKKTSGHKAISVQTNDRDSVKKVKIAGSFLNRKMANPKIISTMRKDCETRNLIVPSPLPPSESNSQDYVIINTDVKFDVNRLTEHQKESLKRHRDDIPAMYNDLSQSESRNTQQLEDWFKNRFEESNSESHNRKNADNNVVMDGEANKENNHSRCIDTIGNKEMSDEWTIEPKVAEDNSHVLVQMDPGEDRISDHSTGTQMSLLVDDKIDVQNGKEDIGTNEHISHIMSTKMNFDAHEKFCAENEEATSTVGCSLSSRIVKFHTLQTITTQPNTKSSTSRHVVSAENTESQSLESLHTKRCGRSRGTSTRADKKPFRSTRLSNNGDDGIDRNLKRKAAIHGESERFSTHKRRRYSVLSQSSSDTTSDVESINSTEGENNTTTIPDVDIPKRTKKEMSRLQINMVFNSRMPRKLRSKQVDDYVYGNNNRRQKNKSSDRNASRNGSSQELVTHRKPREIQSLPNVETDTSKSPTQTPSLKNDGLNPKFKCDIEIAKDDKDKERSKNAICSVAQTEIHEYEDTVENKEFKDTWNNPDISNEHEFTGNQPPIDNFGIDRIEDEEVIESSQKPNSLVKSPQRHVKNNDERCISFDSLMKRSPAKDILHEDSDVAVLNSNSVTQQIEMSQNLPHEKTNGMNFTSFNFSSPKTVKRSFRTKVFTPQGRAAHMLGLVTKMAIVEKNESSENIKCSEDETSKKFKYPKESEVDGMKKERTLILKEPERIGSPSGSRQEKIFNNMKSIDYMSSPPPKLFSNLKNNGEKVSPKFVKTMSIEFTKSNWKDHDIESNISWGRDELPMLEWSNANPPSLTASPSVSILKRQRQIQSDIDIETMFSKKKRVSFTDPPVSREMGYEVISELSPIKVNKFGQSRSFIQRKDSLGKMKQSKFRGIQIDVEKPDILASDKSKTYLLSEMGSYDHRGNEIPMEEGNDLTDKSNKPDGINDNFGAMNPCVDETNTIPLENISNGNPPLEFHMAIDDVDRIDHRPSSDLIIMKELQPGISTTEEESILVSHNSETQDHKDANNCNNHIMNITNPVGTTELQSQNDETDSTKFNITDDPTIARILNDSGDSSKSNNLEDTVDIQNVSNFNSTANSDDLFDVKLARTSTQIAAMTAIAQSETLPVTDSMFLSQASSQDSLATQKNFAMTLPNTMDITNPICPTLLRCDDPIDVIVNDLVNPLWTKNLSKYFAARNIKTIGALAQLSEREIARFPVKGSPKAIYVKQVLDKFSVSYITKSKNRTTQEVVATTNDAVHSTSRMHESSTRIIEELTEHISDSNYDDDDDGDGDGDDHGNDSNINLTAASLSPINSSQKNNKFEEESTGVVKEMSPRHVNSRQSNDFGSIILDTSISLPPENLTTNSTERFSASPPVKIENSFADSIQHNIPTSATNLKVEQMDWEKLLDEIDPNLLLHSAIKRSASEDIMAQYKMKMQDKSDAEFTKMTLGILGLEISTESDLKNACREYGVTKVLECLPAIFNTDNNFFSKVLNTYRAKITAEDCISALDLNQIKKAISKKYSSSEICDMLSAVLDNEAKNDINTPITGVSSLNAMLKRMPMDSIISHTVANDELIPPPFVLEIALQNNNSDTITHALDAQYPSIVENIMDRNMSVDRIISYMNKSQLSRDKLFNIYRAVCDKLSPGQVLDAHYEVMKEKLNIHDINDPQ